jgi:hypothetical protein
MTIFFDSDILLDVIESRNFPESNESLEICERLGFDIVTSWHSLNSSVTVFLPAAFGAGL